MTPGRDKYYFYVPRADIAEDQAVITDANEYRHLVHALRKRPGDRITCVDGAGWIYEGRVASIEPAAIRLHALTRRRDETEPSVHLTLAPALLKGARLDVVVEKGTELGVAEIIPMQTSRTVAGRNASSGAARRRRWRRIARSAMKQSLRSRLPAIAPVTGFHQVIERADAYDLALIAWEEETRATIETVLMEGRQPGRLLLLIGPEGGFEAEEITAARQVGLRPVSLGRRRFRADTAALLGIAAVMAASGGL